MLKKVFGALLVTALLYSCGTQQKEAETANETITVDNLVANIDNYIDKDIIVSGTISHVCAHGGKRLFLVGENPDLVIKVIPTETLGIFEKDIEGGYANIYGIVKELRIDEAYINDLEKELSEGVESEAVHDGNHSGQEVEGAVDSTQIQKIADMRQELAASEKGYISQYWIECNKFEIQEFDETTEEAIVEEKTEETTTESTN